MEEGTGVRGKSFRLQGSSVKRERRRKIGLEENLSSCSKALRKCGPGQWGAQGNAGPAEESCFGQKQPHSKTPCSVIAWEQPNDSRDLA